VSAGEKQRVENNEIESHSLDIPRYFPVAQIEVENLLVTVAAKGVQGIYKVYPRWKTCINDEDSFLSASQGFLMPLQIESIDLHSVTRFPRGKHKSCATDIVTMPRSDSPRACHAPIFIPNVSDPMLQLEIFSHLVCMLLYTAFNGGQIIPRPFNRI